MFGAGYHVEVRVAPRVAVDPVLSARDAAVIDEHLFQAFEWLQSRNPELDSYHPADPRLYCSFRVRLARPVYPPAWIFSGYWSRWSMTV